MSTITEVELIKSYTKDYFNNLDDKIKSFLEPVEAETIQEKHKQPSSKANQS